MTIHKNGHPKKPEPVYFHSLELENVRCFGPKQTLDLTDGKGRPSPWTVILGDNGVGKTTLLQALASCGEDPIGREYQRFVLNPTDSFIRNGLEGFEFSAAVFVGKKLSDSKRGEPISARVRFVGERREGGVSSTRHGAQSFVCCGYGANRKMYWASTPEGRAKQNQQTDPTLSLFFDEPLRNAVQLLLEADHAATAESPYQKIAQLKLEQLKEIFSKIIPNEPELLILTEATARGRFERVVVAKTAFGNIPLSQLSLGYQTMITWVLDFVSRLMEYYPDSEDPLSEAAVVLVDEIDLHLHPRWQRTIMEYLTSRFPNTQFIVTAHSPLVVQAASETNLILLRQEGDHVVIENARDKVRGWRVDQILTSELFGLPSSRPPQLDKLLAERKKLLLKDKLTKIEKARLQTLEAKLEELPGGETKEEMEATRLILQAARALEQPRAIKK